MANTSALPKAKFFARSILSVRTLCPELVTENDRHVLHQPGINVTVLKSDVSGPNGKTSATKSAVNGESSSFQQYT
jgi:hypothetical protein